MSEPPVMVDAPQKPDPLPPPRYTDDERSIIDHLGLPFFYRHTPTPAMRRGLFWMGFAVIGLALFLNFLFMPHAQGSISRTIRESIFGYGQGYRDSVQGCAAIFHQFFVAAMILSGIIAPGFATFSLSTERVSGTMESLRLSPMSTTAIILGKITASAYWMHMVSALLIGMGIIFGIIGDLGIKNIALAILGIVLGCMTLHAVGAYFAIFTIAARGFGAVVALLGIGFVMSMLPMAGMEEQGMEFFNFLSPWGCMDGLFWKEMHWRQRYNTTPQFFGMPGAVKFYVLAFHFTASALFIWAASRKLDAPERPALPKIGWCLVWAFILFTAFGVTFNTFRTRSFGFNYEWMFAAIILIFGFIGTCVLALLDHPHDRDTVLAEECERVAGRENKRRFRAGHAIFAAALTAVSGATVVFFFYMGGSLTGEAVPVSISICTAAVVLAFFIAIALETASIGYLSTWSRTATAFIAVAILFATLFAPLIHVTVAYSRFRQAMWAASSSFPNPDLPEEQKKQVRTNNYWNVDWARRQPHIMIYLEGVNSWDDVQAMRQKYENEPMKVFLNFHPTAALTYPLLFVLVIGSLTLWRRSKYNALAREAEASIARADAMAPVVEKPVLAESVPSS